MNQKEEKQNGNKLFFIISRFKKIKINYKVFYETIKLFNDIFVLLYSQIFIIFLF